MSTPLSDIGTPTEIARMLGIKVPSVIGWNGRPPAERCPALERGTDARFTVEQLRPDITWTRVPDPDWPHPEGRPCIDVAAPAKATAEAQQAA